MCNDDEHRATWCHYCGLEIGLDRAAGNPNYHAECWEIERPSYVMTIDVARAPRVCDKCGEAFTKERPEVVVGDDACGYWKPRFSAHSECIRFAGNSGVPLESDPRTKLVRVAVELLPKLREWSEPVRFKITGDDNGVLTLLIHRGNELPTD